MIPEDRPAALAALALAAVFFVITYVLAEAVIDIWRNRPMVTKDPHTGDLQIVRSPNPQHRPRRHGHRR